jgi:nucleotide-binding universal stress UspA family protein
MKEDGMSTSGRGTARVVVGYDASASAKVAVGWAADEAERLGVPLDVVYAADYTGLVGGPISTSTWLPGVSIDAARRVAEAGVSLARARRPGLEVEARVRMLSPGTVLIQESERAAMVVVGTRGRGDLAGTLLGSVSSRVAAHTHCPVAVVRGDDVVTAGRDRPVVVGADDSPAAAGALRAAVSQASARGAGLRVVCAWIPPVPESWEGAYWLAVDAARDPDQTARAAAERVAAEATLTAQGLAPELRVETQILGGDSAAVILDAAADAGLVVSVPAAAAVWPACSSARSATPSSTALGSPSSSFGPPSQEPSHSSGMRPSLRRHDPSAGSRNSGRGEAMSTRLRARTGRRSGFS